MKNKPILITGAARSGTTWVGRTLAQSQDIYYIGEPFNPNIKYNKGRCGANFKYFFTYISSENQDEYYKYLKKTFSLSYNLYGALKDIKDIKSFRVYLGEYRNFLLAKLQNRRALIKDPIGIFSAEWMASNFNCNVVVLIRNPLAFVGSFKKAGWMYDFNGFLEQPALMKNYLSSFSEEIQNLSRKQGCLLEKAILLYRTIYYVVHKYQQEHNDWIFIKHEDLSKNPVEGFADLFDKLKIDFTEEIKNNIIQNSYAKPEKDSDIPALKTERNSLENLNAWKNRLTEEEVNKVKEETKDVADYFY